MTKLHRAKAAHKTTKRNQHDIILLENYYDKQTLQKKRRFNKYTKLVIGQQIYIYYERTYVEKDLPNFRSNIFKKDSNCYESNIAEFMNEPYQRPTKQINIFTKLPLYHPHQPLFIKCRTYLIIQYIHLKSRMQQREEIL